VINILFWALQALAANHRDAGRIELFFFFRYADP
jgi:hypothetical protein